MLVFDSRYDGTVANFVDNHLGSILRNTLGKPFRMVLKISVQYCHIDFTFQTLRIRSEKVA